MRDILSELISGDVADEICGDCVGPLHYVNFLRDEDEYPEPAEGEEISYLYEKATGFPQLQDRLSYYLGM